MLKYFSFRNLQEIWENSNVTQVTECDFVYINIYTVKNNTKTKKKKKKKMYWEKERPRQIRAQQKEIDISYQRKTNSNAKKNNFWKYFLDINLRSQNCNLKDLMCDRCLWIVMSC